MPDHCSIGTDVGGTFTDLVFVAPSGEAHCFKVPSTPSRPGESILTGVAEIRAALHPDAAAWRDAFHTHSSTVATNALIERRGARVGMIATSGFRDMFELQRLALPHPMRFDSRRPAPLVPREWVREVAGRLGPNGEELEPLDAAGALTAARELAAAGVEIAVVALLHSYRNPAHERRVRDLIERDGIALRLELSSEVWPQAREYERAVLTAINAGVRPVIEAYVGRLTDGLGARDLALPARVARSNGGAELARTMRERPVVALLSGPAAGVAGAADAAEDAGWLEADLMTLDVGGTSADIGVIRDGRAVLSSEEVIGEFPVLLPTVAVSSIGAGGGSIVWLDSTGSLKVGPRSVGADPGPACYGSGSLLPALTDAFLLAGFLTPGQRLGGKLALQPAPARAALDTIGRALSCAPEQVADGAIRVATAMLAAEATRVLARRGVDAPRFRMVAFGGAGPLLAALMAEEIAIDTILVPPFPGALSALGAARADIEGDLVQPIYRRLHEIGADELTGEYQTLKQAGTAWMAEQGDSGVSATLFRYAADMRYEGQGYDVAVALDEPWLVAGDRDRIAAAFHAAHRATYGHATEENEVWLKELRVHIVGTMPRPRVRAVRDDAPEPRASRSIRLFGREMIATVVSRGDVRADETLAGPAIINQMDTTTLVPPGWTASLAPSGALILRSGSHAMNDASVPADADPAVAAPSVADAATTEIFANLFKAVVDEMAWILLRSSHTTFVKETQDFAVALVTPDGETFAYPYGSGATPIMGVPMHAGTRAFDDWEPGDVLLTNDPYTTGGMVMHLNDIYLFRPIFVGGVLLCFAWAFIHCTDVGGYAPGSIDMQNYEVFQEGFRLRPFRLYRRGELNTEMWHVFADNCRIPALNWGDLTACTAALAKAEQRVQRLAQRYGHDTVAAAIRGTLDRTEHITRDVLVRIPAGEYRFTEFFEDDYISDLPVRIALKLVSHGDGRVTLDYTGSDPQVRAALNLPAGGMRHHPFLSMGLVNFVVTKSEAIHINAGILRCIDLVLPEASVVNARFPAACGMRFTTAMRVHDLVVGALSQALPGAVPAGGGNTLVVSYISTSEQGDRGRVVVANPVLSGSAGGPDRDGASGTDFSVAFLRNVPVEVLESEVPVLVRGYGLIPDSEGAGKYRGGFGTSYEVEVRHPSAVLVMRGKDRFKFGSWGAFGGGGGSVNGNTGRRGDATHDIGKRTVYRPELGEQIRMWSGGGGGYGDPLERDPAAVRADVVSGLVSVARARDVYGVVVSGGAVDAAATVLRRDALRARRGVVPMFDFGPGRSEWERLHGVAAALIADWLPGLPTGVRRYAQAQAYRRLHEIGPGPYAAIVVKDVLASLTFAGS